MHAAFDRCLSKAWPAGVGGHIVVMDGVMLAQRGHTRTFVQRCLASSSLATNRSVGASELTSLPLIIEIPAHRALAWTMAASVFGIRLVLQLDGRVTENLRKPVGL